jgi:hypothetical protein
MHPVTPVIAIMRVMWSGRVDGIGQHVQRCRLADCRLAGHG